MADTIYKRHKKKTNVIKIQWFCELFQITGRGISPTSSSKSVFHTGGLICLICPLEIPEMIRAKIRIRLNRQNVFTC